MQNPERTRHFIAALHNRGCRFALDDFGTGAGSLQQLKLLHVDFVRLGEDLQRRVDSDSTDFEILLSINRVAKMVGTRTIVGEVGDGPLRETLHRIGIDYVHGRIAGEPRPLHPDAGEQSPAAAATGGT